MALSVEKILLCLTLLPSLFTLCDCGAPAPEPCKVDNFNVQKDFNLTRYMGAWYEIKWIPGDEPPEDWYQDYKQILSEEDSGNVKIETSARLPGKDCFSGKLSLLKTNKTAKFLRAKSSGEVTGDYWIMQTDYVNYAVIYGCKEKASGGTCSDPNAKVMSRSKTLTQQLMNTVDSKLEELCLNLTTFSSTPQTKDCPTGAASQLKNPLLLLYFAIIFVVYHVIKSYN